MRQRDKECWEAHLRYNKRELRLCPFEGGKGDRRLGTENTRRDGNEEKMTYRYVVWGPWELECRDRCVPARSPAAVVVVGSYLRWVCSS